MSDTPSTHRERFRAALHSALTRCGMSVPDLARLLGVGEHIANAWLRPDVRNSIPAWAVALLATARPDVHAAIEAALAPCTVVSLDDARVQRLMRSYGEAMTSLATEGRRTTEGARVALRALSRVEGEQRQIEPALRVLAEVKRAA